MSKLILIVLLLSSGICKGANFTLPEFQNDSIYKSLLNKRIEFKTQESELNIKLDSLRESYHSAPDSLKKVCGEEILFIESQLYDIRSQIADTDFKISSIEQKHLLKTIRNNDNINNEYQNNITTSNFKKSRYLLNNRFLSQNLPHEEYKKLRLVQKNESIVRKLEVEFKNNYSELEKIQTQYDSVKTQYQADSLFNVYKVLTKQILILEDSLINTWTPCYDTKVYAYSYLLDKINRTDLLKGLNEKLYKTQITPTENNNYQSDLFASLEQEKIVILNYEQTLADVLDLTEAADSIKSELENIQNSVSLTYPKIELQRLDLTPYSRISNKSIYKSHNSIPKHEQPLMPIVYKIQLGTFQKPQAISIFRKVTPLSYEKLADGRYRYYAGLYKNYDEVLEDIEYLKKLGFRRPEPVVWDNGSYINLAEDVGKSYRIEFTCKDDILRDSIKELINIFAQGCESSRVNTETGIIYIIGIFDSRIKAMQLSSALNELEDVSAKITVVE